jgi:hypothetical protein
MINKLKHFTLGVSLLFIFACQTNDSISTESPGIENTVHSAAAKVTVANPYEFAGIRHNAFLDYLNTQPNAVDLNQIVDLSINFSNQNNFQPLTYVTKDAIIASVNSSVTQPFMESLDNLHSQGKISSIVYAQLQNLGNILNNVNEQDGIDGLVQNIENLEQECLLLDLNEIDKPVLLSTLSVAKYSSHYWRTIYFPTSGASKIGAFLKALLNVAAVIGADAIGAAAGAAIGVGVAAITAGVTVPVVVPGMAVAVAGAASGVVAKDPPVK